ncbi:MAG TPA: PilZ domain-containing protein [Gammaproteobacteria bacterium]
MSNDTHEKRHYSRVPFDTEATLIDSSTQWQSNLIDISLKGALLERPQGWEGNIGDQCTLELPLGNNEIIIRMKVIVARIDHNHIGFHCKNIDFNSIVHLRRLMELNLGDTELVNRELSALG